MSTNPLEEEDVEEEVQELGHAETYANYMPKKCKYIMSKQSVLSNKKTTK